MMRCPGCNQKLIQHKGDTTQVRIKGKILLKSDGAHTQCFWCGRDVVIPMQLSGQTVKPGAKLVLRKRGRIAGAEKGVDAKT